jgi:hypothetical protein
MYVGTIERTQPKDCKLEPLELKAVAGELGVELHGVVGGVALPVSGQHEDGQTGS